VVNFSLLRIGKLQFAKIYRSKAPSSGSQGQLKTERFDEWWPLLSPPCACYRVDDFAKVVNSKLPK